MTQGNGDRISVRPDTLTKSVVGVVSAVLVTLMGWTAVNVSDLKERMARVEEKQTSIGEAIRDLKAEVRK